VVPMFTRYGNADIPFWSYFCQFQIQLPVTVRILELYRMKKLLGVN
jgi:hypothetical protein